MWVWFTCGCGHVTRTDKDLQCAHVSIEAGEDDLPLSSMWQDHLENLVCHEVAIKVRETVLVIGDLWDRVLDLYVEPYALRDIVRIKELCIVKYVG